MMMIFSSYTIIDPWTMMIESFNTLIANGAMSGSYCADDFTIGAQHDRIKYLQHTLHH